MSFTVETYKNEKGELFVYIAEENSSGWKKKINDMSEIGSAVNEYVSQMGE